MQRELALLSQTTDELREIDMRIVARCNTMPEVYRECINHSKVCRSQESISDLIGINQSQFKQALRIKSELPKYMPPEAEEKLQLLCGNLAPSQWRGLYRAGMLDFQRQDLVGDRRGGDRRAADRRRVAR